MFRRGKLTFLSTKDDRIKIINERINQTERHLTEMCAAFAACTRKMAKYRDSYDELAKSIKSYADDEEINESLSTGLKSFTNAVTILGDYMDINVHRMEHKIVNELAQFEQLCKSTRDNLRLAVIARDKEVLKQRQMLELKSKFSANNSAADSELVKAKMEVQRTNKEIDEIIGNFEQHKLADIKNILSDFILISMKYHTKALEVLSMNYYDISNIDEKDDFMVFQKLMKSQEESSANRKAALKKGLRSQSMDSLERDQLMSPLKRTSKLSRSSKNLNSGIGGTRKAATSDEDDDDDEDDGEEEEDDDDEEDEDDEEDASSARDTARSGQDSGSASDDEREAKQKPRENVFGARMRNTKSDATVSKPTRNAVKHPFKAVAATHVIKTQIHKKRTSKPGISGGGTSLTGGGIATSSGKGISSNERGAATSGGGGSRLVTIVESKRKSSVERTPTTFLA